MAGSLDQSANARAGEAAKMVTDVLEAEAKRRFNLRVPAS
jgi:hypothetical protein